MKIKDLKKDLEASLKNDIIKCNEKLKDHTSFKLGGPCEILITPTSDEEVITSVKLCKKWDVPFFIIGNGSNLIIKDGGFKGVIIKLTSLKDIICAGEKVVAKAGATLASVSAVALKNSLKGMEFASGIPGTVGGAIAMNAGAYGGEMKDILESVKVINEQGEIFDIALRDLELGYRTSIVQKNNYIVLEAVFSLEIGNESEIRDRMNDLNTRRKDKQPLSYPSAGSTFKRPPNNFAGKLIEDAGLKGYSVGGAMVSEKHAGFVINYDNATANDVLTLIGKVQEKIKDTYDIELETEVKIIGEE